MQSISLILTLALLPLGFLRSTEAQKCTADMSTCASQRTPCRVSIFVHGLTKVHFAFLSPARVLRDTLSGTTWYEACIQRNRQSRSGLDSSLMLDEGLVDLTGPCDTTQNTPPLEGAARDIIGAFVAMEQACASPSTQPIAYRHYSFGWSALLSSRARSEAAEQLQKALLDLRTTLRSQNYEPEFHIYAYSHGGVVALLLAEAPESDPQDPLVIARLILLATPLYHTLGPVIHASTFREIINVYAPSDWVQTVDPLGPRPIFATMAELLAHHDMQPPAAGRIDVAVVVNHEHMCNHYSFFNYNRFVVPRPPRSRRSPHYLAKHGRDLTYETLKRINPLPLVSIFPAMADLIMLYHTQTTSSHALFNLTLREGVLAGECYPRKPSPQRGRMRFTKAIPQAPLDTYRQLQ